MTGRTNGGYLLKPQECPDSRDASLIPAVAMNSAIPIAKNRTTYAATGAMRVLSPSSSRVGFCPLRLLLDGLRQFSRL